MAENERKSPERQSKRRIVTVPIPGKSAPLIPVPPGSIWLDVLYPGCVVNPDKAISFLSPPLTDKTTEVELNCRPGNASCIPLRSVVKPAVKLIVKVNRQTKAVRVIGIVRSQLRFNKLADFQLQYAPAPPPPNYFNIPSPLIDMNYIAKDKHAIRVVNKQLALRDEPFDYFYQSTGGTKTKTGEIRERKARPSLVIHWKSTESEVPTAPLMDTDVTIVKQNYVNQYRDKIEEMFRQRPIWTTMAFANVIELRYVPLRTQLLPRFAYYCQYGPWRSMWIRLGYDPRLDPVNRNYQLIDFRAPKDGHLVKRFSSVKSHKSKLGKPDEDEVENESDLHIYRADKLPIKRQCHYQVCDIHDRQCQTILKNFETDVYTHDDGFYSKGAFSAAREIMAEQIRNLLKGSNGEGLDEAM